MNGPVTCIRNAAWIAAWDADAQAHCYHRDADVAFAGDTLLQVGGRYSGPVATEIAGDRLFVMPGLVNVHNHTSSQPVFKGIREETGNRQFYMSNLYDLGTSFPAAPADRRWNSQYAYCELLLSGCTTIVDMCMAYPEWLDVAGRSGLRTYIAPMFGAARWSTANGHQLDYLWDEDGGSRAFAAAMALLDDADAHPSGRLSGMVSPTAVDVCTPDLLRQGHAAALRHGRPFHLHTGFSVMEFLEMTRRTGVTPVQYLAGLGLLSPTTTLVHALFLDHHSWLHWWSRRDLDLIAGSGTMVAHCPVVFSRYGITMEDFGNYRARGITLGIGTDASPHNMLDEMRGAAIAGRIAAGNTFALSTADIFHAATAGGASILLRDDIGRLAPGAKADLVLVDLDHPAMQPVYDPIRSLIYTAGDRAIRDVYVGGKRVVADGRVLTLDYHEAAGRLGDAQAAMVAAAPRHDRNGRQAHEISPLTLPMRETMAARTAG